MIHYILERYRGGYHRRCAHRSHHLHLPCYRGFGSDGYCSRHNASCYWAHGVGLGMDR